MGANEKHAATYHGLSDDTVRGRHCDGTHAQTGHTTDGAEYDQWLAKVRAEAKAEALEEAADEINQIDPSWNSALWIEEQSHYMPVPEWLRARANQYKENQ